MQIIVSKTNVLFCLFSCAQAPVIVIESEEEKEEPAAESTFVPVEPEGMSASLKLSHCLSAQFCAVQSGNLQNIKNPTWSVHFPFDLALPDWMAYLYSSICIWSLNVS